MARRYFNGTIVRGLSFFVLAVFVFSSSLAQKSKPDNYKEEAEETRRAVWNWDKSEFKVREIPAEYANASKVVIARRIEINASGKNRIAFFNTRTTSQLDLSEVVREVIKLNDKAAVSDYSEIAFTRLAKTSGGVFNSTTKRYIGVRVIKADGTTKEINADDILLTKDDKTNKEAKLAIPDLQVGDIVDYFIAKRQNIQPNGSGDIENYTFALFDDAPVMNYAIHIETGRQYAVEYRNYNGAPDFEQGLTENNDNTFDISLKNIPAYEESNLWVSPFRQLPIMRMNLKAVTGFYGGLRNRQAGRVYANPLASDYVADEEAILNYLKNIVTPTSRGLDLPGNISKYYSELLKNKDKLPPDSFAASMYYLHRYASLLDITSTSSGIEDIVDRVRQPISQNKQVYDFGALLRSRKINYNIVLATPQSGPAFDEILGTRDIDWLILMGGDKKRFLGVTDIFSPAFYLPYEYERNNQAITFDPNDGTNFVAHGTVDIPASEAPDNSRAESIRVNLAANNATLQVDRRTILKGHYKRDIQERLILFEDYCNAERKLFGEDKTIIEELQEKKGNWKSFSAELQSAFDKERSQQKDAFTSEAKDWFDQPVSDLSDYKIENMGVRHNNPDFVYSSKFHIDGLVKKAGNNLIIDIGKLEGSTLKSTPALRRRKLDVYMPFARSIQSQIVLQVPDGYTVEGLNELNKKVENGAGRFVVEAVSDGHTVTITIKKTYNHSYESIGNWDKLVEVIDASSDWSNAKVLLKKK